MKPLELEMYAFGAFAKPCKISFADWQNGTVFLITGETGAGKTTIFDAICFALYGTASGFERDSKQFRSQYITDQREETKVRLLFSCGDAHYQVERNPYYERQSKRGNGTIIQKPDAVLDRMLPDGKRENICSGVMPVNHAIEDLLGMDSKQFRQIVMIAQGEFRRFLLADSTEKGKILSKLFHTEYCSDVKNALKAISDQKAQAVQHLEWEIQTKLQQTAPIASTSQKAYQTLLQEYGVAATETICNCLEADYRMHMEQMPAWEAEQSVKRLQIEKLVGEIAQGQQHNAAHIQLKKQQAALLTIQQKRADALRRIEQVEEVATRLPDWQAEKTLLENSLPAYQQMATLQQRIAAVQQDQQATKQRFIRKKSELEQLQQDCDCLQKDLSKHVAVMKELAQLQQDMTKEREMLTVLQRLQKQMQDCQAAAKRCQQYEKQAQAAHQTYFEKEKPAYDAIERQFFASMAGNLAETLQAEQPCPVCGSTVHPHPAEKSAETVTETAFQQAREKQLHAAQKMQEQKHHLETQQTLCSQLEQQTQEILQQYHFPATMTLDCLQMEMAEKQTTIRQLMIAEQAKQVQLHQLEQKKADLERKQNKMPALQMAVELEQQMLSTIEQDLVENKTALAHVQTDLRYPTLQEAKKQRDALQQKIELTQQQQRLSSSELQQQEQQLAICQTEIKRLETEIDGKPLYDISAATVVLQNERQTLEQQQKKIAEQKAKLKQMNEIVKTVRVLWKTLEQEKVAAQRYHKLYGMANGDGGERVSFERYVQAYYFNRVLAHANQKLYQLSAGRYQLRRRETETQHNISAGLNLNVLDQYTGMERDVKTLSGGETFLASLSLALGLSDTVQQQSGSVQINAMFIDEGFGSLDAVALENAVALLQQLSGNDRMVGIISHVASLTERFPAQIVVEKTPSGSLATCRNDIR